MTRSTSRCALLVLLAAVVSADCDRLLPFSKAPGRADAPSGEQRITDLGSRDGLRDGRATDAGGEGLRLTWQFGPAAGTETLLGLWAMPATAEVLAVGNLCTVYRIDVTTGVLQVPSWATKCPLDGFDYYGAAGTSANDYFIVGHTNGAVRRITNGSLQPLEYTVPDYARALAIPPAGVPLVAGHNGQPIDNAGWVARRASGTWVPWDAGKTFPYPDLTGMAVAGAKVVIVGRQGTILRLDVNGTGQAVKESADGVTAVLNGVWSAADGSWAVAVGEGPVLLHYQGTWTSRPLSLPGLQSLEGVWAASPSRVFVVGSGPFTAGEYPCSHIPSNAQGWVVELDLSVKSAAPVVTDKQPTTKVLCAVTGLSFQAKTYVVAVGEVGTVVRRAGF